VCCVLGLLAGGERESSSSTSPFWQGGQLFQTAKMKIPQKNENGATRIDLNSTIREQIKLHALFIP
jgi:hypothetical protein